MYKEIASSFIPNIILFLELGVQPMQRTYADKVSQLPETVTLNRISLMISAWDLYLHDRYHVVKRVSRQVTVRY